jgi:hypothetical protein
MSVAEHRRASSERRKARSKLAVLAETALSLANLYLRAASVDQLKQRAISFLGDQKNLRRLGLASKDLEAYLGVVGAETLSELFSAGIRSLLSEDAGAASSLVNSLERLSGLLESGPDGYSDQIIAALVLKIGNEINLLGRINDVLKKATMVGNARARRNGDLSIWTDIEDKQIEEILSNEFSQIEQTLFAHLQADWQARDVVKVTTVNSSLPHGQRQPETTSPKMHSPPSRNGPSEMMSWTEMQTLFNSIDASVLASEWLQEPRKTLLWIYRNGSAQQWFYYVYMNAKLFDAEMREMLLEALLGKEWEESEEIPPVWRVALSRALSFDVDRA